jgi:hypothetical protein
MDPHNPLRKYAQPLPLAHHSLFHDIGDRFFRNVHAAHAQTALRSIMIQRNLCEKPDPHAMQAWLSVQYGKGREVLEAMSRKAQAHPTGWRTQRETIAQQRPRPPSIAQAAIPYISHTYVHSASSMV